MCGLRLGDRVGKPQIAVRTSQISFEALPERVEGWYWVQPEKPSAGLREPLGTLLQIIADRRSARYSAGGGQAF